MSADRSAATTESCVKHVRPSGCYGCGGPVTHFGGFVSPAIIDFGRGLIIPQVARWWTRCEDCGYIEVTE